MPVDNAGAGHHSREQLLLLYISRESDRCEFVVVDSEELAHLPGIHHAACGEARPVRHSRGLWSRGASDYAVDGWVK